MSRIHTRLNSLRSSSRKALVAFITGGDPNKATTAPAMCALVAGGADVIDQFLAAGLVDELVLHLVPLVLGGGARLFAGVGPDIALEQIRVVEAPGVTHLTYAVRR